MLTYGTGASGLAILGLAATEGDAHSRKPLRRIPMVWRAIPRERIDDVLCGTLFGHTEPIIKGQAGLRGEAFLSECHARGIRAIVTIGSQALRAVSPVHGRSIKLIGATITTGEVPYIIPVDTHWGGFRAFRAHAWVLAMTRFIRRAAKLAQGHGHLYQFPSIVTDDTPEALAALERIYDEKLPVGNDIETTGRDWRSDAITAMGLANANVAVSVPWDAYTSCLYGPQAGLRSDAIEKLVRAILADTRITKLFHNGLFDLSVLGQKHISVAGPVEDTYLAHKIAHPDLFHNLQFAVANEHAVVPWKTLFDLARKARKEGDEWADTAPQPLMTYNAQDAAVEVPLWARLADKIEAMPRGWEAYRQLMALGGMAAQMKYHGVRVDLAARNEVANEALGRIKDIESRWQQRFPDQKMAGKGSDKAVRHLIFDTLKAPVLSRSKRTSKASLNAASLLEYAGMRETHPELAFVAWTLFEYRKICKSYNGFLKPLVIDRVYASPNPAGTRGSRFSYSDPNLQQWSKAKSLISPYTKEEVVLAQNLRHLILPDEGFVLGEHDYNALEVRLVAYAANIMMWLEWLRDGRDMHIEHVKLMLERTVGKADPLRQIIKTLTFARFYNRKRSVKMVLKSLKPAMPTLTEAFLLEVFRRFDKAVPGIEMWQSAVEASVKKTGYVELPISGLRQYHDVNAPDINAALSYGIQSTGGDILAAAMLRIDARLDHEAGERILLNVHDALLWQARPHRVQVVGDIVREEMERPVDLWDHRGVVLPTECKVGVNWRDLKAA